MMGEDKTAEDAELTPQEATARRVRAAQALGGFTSIPKMAEAMKPGGLTASRLHEIVQKRGTEAQEFELRQVATACTVPYGLFTLDLQKALDERAEIYEQRLKALERRLGIATAAPEADPLPKPPGELRQPPQGRRPKEKPQQQNGTQKVRGQSQGGDG